MFLILEQQQSDLGYRLKGNAESRGINTFYATAANIAREILLEYRLDDREEHFIIRHGKLTIHSGEILGVYCALNNFWPELWPDFTPEDAGYAAQETYALWLAMLTSISCRVINQPALDSLAGQLLSVPETLCRAQNFGFRVPLSLTMESGEAATPLISNHSSVQFTDLGDGLTAGKPPGKSPIPEPIITSNHCRITEIVPGRVVYVALIGERFYVSDNDKQQLSYGNDDGILPDKVKSGLKAIQRSLNLNMAEYYLRESKAGSWIFSGYGRIPEQAIEVYGEEVISYMIDYAIGNGGR